MLTRKHFRQDIKRINEVLSQCKKGSDRALEALALVVTVEREASRSVRDPAELAWIRAEMRRLRTSAESLRKPTVDRLALFLPREKMDAS